MSEKPRRAVAVVANGKRAAPVRVKLQRINCNEAKAYPPDGQTQEWSQRLKIAFGTDSSDFVEASLVQLIASARLPCSGISNIAVNAALAIIEAAAPRDEIEGALAVQMACCHTSAMAVLARLAGGHGSERRVAAFGSAAARLLKAYAAQVEVLRRLRHGGQQTRQFVRVEHVHINEGGQAIIGNVRPDSRSGASRLTEPSDNGECHEKRVCRSAQPRAADCRRLPAPADRSKVG